MPRKIQLRREQRSLESVGDEESNFLLAVKHNHASMALRPQLWLQRRSIEAVVRHHLGLASDAVCTLLGTDEWIQGGFNICLLLHVPERAGDGLVVFRCPLMYKLAEDVYPGTVDEKIRSEVATYVWMQNNCPDIRIPALYAFGLKDGSHFTHIRRRPLYARICHSVRRWIYQFLNYPLLSDYVRDESVPAIETPYMLMEHIGSDVGEMLSLTWKQHLNDADRRTRLFHGLSRVMLSLARLPQPRIGSFLFNTSDSTISLSNRPMTCTMMIFENGGTPRAMEPGQTYQCTESFVADSLTLYDNHFLHDHHSVRTADDAQERMALRTLLRAVSHHFILSRTREGPFLPMFTDLSHSNIFVDENWEVTALVDLEWVCTLPVEMLSVPYWLTDCCIGSITGDNYSVFEETHRDFLAIMDEESKSIPMQHDLELTRTIRHGWESKRVWFYESLLSVNAWLFVLEGHIAPRFSAEIGFITGLKRISMFWTDKIDEVIKIKVDQEEKYRAELQEVFDREGVETE